MKRPDICVECEKDTIPAMKMALVAAIISCERGMRYASFMKQTFEADISELQIRTIEPMMSELWAKYGGYLEEGFQTARTTSDKSYVPRAELLKYWSDIAKGLQDEMTVWEKKEKGEKGGKAESKVLENCPTISSVKFASRPLGISLSYARRVTNAYAKRTRSYIPYMPNENRQYIPG